jgi:hypothetical protein
VSGKSLSASAPARGASGDRAGAGPALLLLVLVAVAFAPLARNGFILVDDVDYLLNSGRLREGFTAGAVRWALTTTHSANWFPLTWFSHMLDFRLFGLDAGAHHLVSLALHAANAVALFLVVRGMTGRLWCAALTAALFGVHPLHVESVAWASCRKDVLSGLFWVLALGAYVRYVRRPGTGRYLALAALFAAGLMAKPTVVTLPALLLLLDWWPLGRLGGPGGGPARPVARRVGHLVLEKAPLLLLAAVSSAVTYRAQQSLGAMEYFRDLPLRDRAANAATSLVAYLAQTVAPRGLSVFYPHPERSLPLGLVVGALALLAAATAAVLAAARARPWLPVGWLWYLGTLVPTLGLVQVGLQARADRYTYLPLTGIFVMVAWSAAELLGGRRRLRRGAAAAGCAALIVLAAASRHQAGLWRDTLTLFEHAAAVTGPNWMAENNIGAAWGNRGDHERALAHFARALEIRPNYPEAMNNYRKALLRRVPGGAGR